MNDGQKLTATELFLVLFGFAGLTAFYFWPMVMDPDQVWSVGRDFFQNSWNLWWVDHAQETGQAYYETDRLFSPTGTSLAFHTISFSNSIPGALLQQSLGLSVGTTHTVLFLSAFLMSGIGAWALARYLTAAPLAAFGAGLFFTFNPYHTAMITQLNNVQFQWMPLVLLGLLWLYDSKSWKAVIFTAVMLALSGYADWYQPVFCAIAGGVLLVVRMWRDKRFGDIRFWVHLLVMGGLAGAMMFPGVRPLIDQMGQTGGGGELEDPIRYIGEMQLTGMSPNGLGGHLFWPVILGWTTMFILLFTAFRVRERGIGSFWWLLVVGFFLVQGPHLVFMNHSIESIPMPMAIFPHIPVLDMVRVPHRFLILLILGITGVIAYGLREIQIQRGVVATFMLLPLLALELQLPKPEAISLRTAKVYEVMQDDPADYAVLEMPIDYRDAYTMWLQTKHEKRLLAGYTSHILPSALEGLESDLMRALHPAQSDTDILGLPEFLEVDVDNLSETQLDQWRRELVVEKEVLYVVFHGKTDFRAPSRAPKPAETAREKLMVALMPFRLNPAVKNGHNMRMFGMKQFMDNLSKESAQGRAIIEKMFGEPDKDLGNLATEVWDLRPWAEQYGVAKPALISEDSESAEE
ncbi:MAG: hypothetical protein O3A95_09445 [Planctomycetota bacterium]|nr:hypothetical protein [Planctomycetota bacterium]MDA1114505.1 hypothetical protein [Planctomycetota bacterium]